MAQFGSAHREAAMNLIREAQVGIEQVAQAMRGAYPGLEEATASMVRRPMTPLVAQRILPYVGANTPGPEIRS